MSRLLALIVVLAACQPFYRDDLRAGRRAENTRAIDKLLDDAEHAAAAGDLRRAVELARAAIRVDPKYSVRGYALLANTFARTGHEAAARAVIAYGVRYFGDAMRAAVVASYVDDELIADALDYLKATTLKAALEFRAHDALVELVEADTATSLDDAMTHYQKWLDRYGVPDHPLEREAVARITKRIGEEIDRGTPRGKRLVAIGPHANAAGTSGDLPGALALYALAFRVLPADKFRAYRGPMARTAAKVTEPAKADPIAWGFAVDGDEALKAGKLGAAIHHYRQAVAHAPWWGNAHANLAELLTLAHRTGDAELERAWANDLGTGGWMTELDAPGVTDLDGDGVLDPADRCPYEPEDRDGFEDADGCPERDNDRDGIVDGQDRCAEVAEDLDGFEDADGCPDLDNDGDGILDTADACPMQPETFNGTLDTDGCPDEGRVVVGSAELAILDPIEFDGKTARLTRTSSKILDAIVATLVARRSLTIEVGVHGNVFGKPERDAVITQARAEAVVKYLVDHGVAASQLTAHGYGDTKPLDPGKDPKALAKNRRVELVVVVVAKP